MQARRFLSLDALRGAAALLVMMFHFSEMAGGRLAPHGYLAVDLFFVLSGFVIANAYGDRLAQGGSVRWFLRARIIRLFPLYALGSLIGLGALILRHKLDLPFYAYLPALLLLPTLWGVSPYPLDGPAWSLGLEFWGNVIYAKTAPILDAKRLRLWLGAGAVMVIAAAVRGHGLHMGWTIHTFPATIGRFCYGFLAGVMLQRLHASGRLKLPQINPWIALCVLTLLLCAPDIGEFRMIYDTTVVLLVFPLMVGCSIEPHVGKSAGAFAHYAGGISYALYLTHVAIRNHLLVPLLLGGASPLLTTTGLIALALLVAVVATYGFDEPLRRKLAKLDRLRIARITGAAIPEAG